MFAGLIVVAVLAFLILGRGGYELKAQFQNSGQLVEGGEVQVAGRNVGSITNVALTGDDLAEVSMEITDDDLTPLHAGTRAEIRAVGAAGIANRYVNLLPGSRSAAELESGATLEPEQTQGIVDLDALLGAFDEDVRADVETLITESADAFAGSTAASWNSMLVKLDPALGHLQGLLEDLAADQTQLARLIVEGDDAATAIASRRSDLAEAVVTSTEWMGALADQRESLAGMLEGAPAALDAGRRTLAKADLAVSEIQPALPGLTRAAGPLGDLLRGTVRTLPDAAPVVADLRSQLPAVRKAMRRLIAVETPLTGAFDELGPAFVGLRPIFEGFRLYSLDLALGVVNGLAGVIGGNFNGQGHYFHANFSQSPQTLSTSPYSDLFGTNQLVPGVLGVRGQQTSTCPGGLTPPAPDGSSPIHDRPDLCNPDHSLPLSVNDPPVVGAP